MPSDPSRVALFYALISDSKCLWTRFDVHKDNTATFRPSRLQSIAVDYGRISSIKVDYQERGEGYENRKESKGQQHQADHAPKRELKQRELGFFLKLPNSMKQINLKHQSLSLRAEMPHGLSTPNQNSPKAVFKAFSVYYCSILTCVSSKYKQIQMKNKGSEH